MRNKMLVYFLSVFFMPLGNQAQTYTETFEGISAPGKPTVFINNGQSFTATTLTPGGSLGGLLGVYIPTNSWTMPNPGGSPTNNAGGGFGVGTACTAGNCSGVSDKFLDNGFSNGKSQTYSVKTTNGNLFTIKNVHLFFSKDNGNTNVVPGSVIITGKKAGAVVFTINKTAGFINGFATNNGFTYINFATEGGNNNTNKAIDEIEFKCDAIVNYFALDNFSWGPATPSLPLHLLDFTGIDQDGSVSLDWYTADEINTSHFELEWSHDAISWQTINNQSASGSAATGVTHYGYIHQTPADLNFYRLRMIDIDGRFTTSKVLKFSRKNENSLYYSNPVKDKLAITLTGNTKASLQFFNSNGAIIKTIQLNSQTSFIDIGNFAPGIYFLRVTQGTSIKTGKIFKQ